jgi:hypothetical protein
MLHVHFWTSMPGGCKFDSLTTRGSVVSVVTATQKMYSYDVSSEGVAHGRWD